MRICEAARPLGVSVGQAQDLGSCFQIGEGLAQLSAIAEVEALSLVVSIAPANVSVVVLGTQLCRPPAPQGNAISGEVDKGRRESGKDIALCVDADRIVCQLLICLIVACSMLAVLQDRSDYRPDSGSG
jgi:hypothetical protein